MKKSCAASETQEAAKSRTTAKGITCHDCGFETRVYHTKKMEGCVVRRRICDRCGHIQKTTEE